jgi:Domain of unknown function (DUF4340)
MMQSRGLLVAAIVLAALIGLLAWSKHASSAKTSEVAASATPSPKILAVNQGDIVKLEIKKKNGDDLVLGKNGSGAWQITSPEQFAADSSAVTSLLSTVSALDADRVVDDKATDLQPYGLAPPATEIVVTETGNKAQQLLLGDDTPTHGGAYAALAGDPRLFIIATYNKSSLDKGLNDLRDKRFLTIDSDKINRLELVAKNSDLEFDHYKDHWQIVKPRPLRADSGPIESFISTLSNAKIDLTQPESERSKTIPSFSRAETVGTIKVMSDAGTQELTVRKVGKDYYAKSSILDAPYKISNDVAQEFSKPVDDFRNKSLFDFGYADPAKIEFKDGTKSYFLTKGGSDWWGGDGKKLDAESAYSFVDKMRDLKADKFVDSGFGNPDIQITVSPTSGSQEKVSLSKTGDNYTAKRDNDSTLYQLDAKSVEDLQHAAAAMKPAGK